MNNNPHTTALTAVSAAVMIECWWERPVTVAEVVEALDVTPQAAREAIDAAAQFGLLAPAAVGWTVTQHGHVVAPSLHAVCKRPKRHALRPGACKPYIAGVAAKLQDYMAAAGRPVTVRELADATDYSRGPVGNAMAAMRHEGAVEMLGRGPAATYALTGEAMAAALADGVPPPAQPQPQPPPAAKRKPRPKRAPKPKRERAMAGTVAPLLLAALEGGPQPAAALIAGSRASEKAVHLCLRRLCDEGLAVRVARGVYALPGDTRGDTAADRWRQAEVLAAVRRGATTWSDVREVVGGSKTSVIKFLVRLVELGRIERVERGVYAVVDPETIIEGSATHG